MTVIYHDPNSLDSNACLEVLKTTENNLEIINIVDNPMNEEKLLEIIKLLNIKAYELIRTDSSIWTEHFQHLINHEDDYDDIEYIKMMTEFPILIQPPIVINKNKAFIGSPPEAIHNII